MRTNEYWLNLIWIYARKRNTQCNIHNTAATREVSGEKKALFDAFVDVVIMCIPMFYKKKYPQNIKTNVKTIIFYVVRLISVKQMFVLSISTMSTNYRKI